MYMWIIPQGNPGSADENCVKWVTVFVQAGAPIWSVWNSPYEYSQLQEAHSSL